MSFFDDLVEEAEENGDDDENSVSEEAKCSKTVENTKVNNEDSNNEPIISSKITETNENSNSSINNENDSNSQDSQDESPLASTSKFKKRLGKNPDVDTSFLPDRERELEENMLR